MIFATQGSQVAFSGGPVTHLSCKQDEVGVGLGEALEVTGVGPPHSGGTLKPSLKQASFASAPSPLLANAFQIRHL